MIVTFDFDTFVSSYTIFYFIHTAKRNVVDIVRKLEDPIDTLKIKYKPKKDVKVDYTTNNISKMTLNRLITKYVDRLDIAEYNIQTIRGLIWGQFTEALLTELIALDDYETKFEEYDVCLSKGR